MNQAGNNIIKAIDALLDARLKKIKYDKTFKSTLLKKLPDNTYEIKYLGQVYHIPNALDSELKIGQCVWVKLPCGDIKQMHVCGIVEK